VNPGGLVYGLYDALGAHRLRPVLTAVKARVIALRHMAAGTTSGYAGKIYERDSVIAIVPIGYSDGLPRVQERGQALLRGHRIPLSGPRHAEYTMMDVTDMAEVQIGDEVVFVGSQGGDEITLSELTTGTDLTETDLLQRLARHPHRHLI
jgi:alanine racemase